MVDEEDGETEAADGQTACSNRAGAAVAASARVVVDLRAWPSCAGGATASVAVVLDGKTLVYAAVGDSCGLLGVPAAGGVAAKVEELIAEHGSILSDLNSLLKDAKDLPVVDETDVLNRVARLLAQLDAHEQKEHLFATDVLGAHPGSC